MWRGQAATLALIFVLVRDREAPLPGRMRVSQQVRPEGGWFEVPKAVPLVHGVLQPVTREQQAPRLGQLARPG